VVEDMHHAEPWPLNGYVYAGNPQVAAALDALIRPNLKPRA